MRRDTIESALKEFQPHIVIHCAALADPSKCEKSHEIAREINVTGTKFLVQSLPDQDTLFIYISTDLVFNGENAPYDETTEPEPLTFYGKTKREGEIVVQRLCPNCIIVRSSLMIGPEAYPGNGSFAQWVDKAFQEREEIPLFNDEYRTPVYVEDITQAMRLLIQHPPAPRLFHLGGPEKITRVEFGTRLATLRGYDTAKIKSIRRDQHDVGYIRVKDVSLNSQLIQNHYSIHLTSIDDALIKIFGSEK